MADVESSGDQGGLTGAVETPSAPQDASDPVIASERGSQATGTGIQDRADGEQKRLLGWSVPDHIEIDRGLEGSFGLFLTCPKHAFGPLRVNYLYPTEGDERVGSFLKGHSHGQSVEYRPDTEARKPRVWNAGDAEPPADVTALVDSGGVLLKRRGAGWWWTRPDGPESNDGDGWAWPHRIGIDHWPLTEVLPAPVPSPVPSSALPAPEDAQKAEEGVSEPLSVRLVRAAHDVLGNDTKHVLDCSTGEAIAAVLRELAAAEQTFGVGTLEDLADEIEEKR